MTIKNYVTVLILVFPLAACRQRTGRLPMQQMEDVLYDINMAESYSTMARDNNHAGGVKNPDSLAIYYRDILAHHNIPAQSFKESMSWYKANPDSLNVMYANIMTRNEKILSDETAKLKP
ncbi:MAG: DUF4296 domain-containing protein [Taibaiella sp.]|nr:DUF4296 domain-containing protein [Taibaiella sp.]